MKPGGIASSEVVKLSNPRPDMIKVLKEFNPPFGT